jgi:hypothetical protein
MRVERIEVDSLVLGRSVLSIADFDPAVDFAAFEERYISEHDPAYVSCKIPSERVSDVHSLEKCGFGFVECQLKALIRLRKPFDVSRFLYDFEEVRNESELQPIVEIAATTFTRDRFHNDPALGPIVGGARCAEYVRRSFHSQDEFVYRLVERCSRRTVAFKTHRRMTGDEVLFLLGGVHPDFKDVGLGAISDFCEFNELIRSGIKTGITHFSTINYPVINLEVGSLGFHIVSASTVLRKIYPSQD